MPLEVEAKFVLKYYDKHVYEYKTLVYCDTLLEASRYLLKYRVKFPTDKIIVCVEF